MLVVWLDAPGPQPVLYGLDVVPAVELASGVPAVVEAVRRLLTDARWAMDWPVGDAPGPRPLYEALLRLTNLSFEELIFGLGVDRARLLPPTVEQSRRAINLIEHLNERGDLGQLAARVRR